MWGLIVLFLMIVLLAFTCGGIAGWIALARVNRMAEQVGALRLTLSRVDTDLAGLRRKVQDTSKALQDVPIQTPAESSTAAPIVETASEPVAELEKTPVEIESPPAETPVSDIATGSATAAENAATTKNIEETDKQPVPDLLDVPVHQAIFEGPIEAGQHEADETTQAISLEEKLGTRLFVWVGGLALLLAGAFLVKYAVDQSWLTPGVRVVLGFAFGAALIGSSYWFKPRSERIAPALCGAGIGVFYASILAGTNLYGMWPGSLGFVLMAINTAGAMFLSLGMGPGVAVLGMLGGFSTPMLIGDIEPTAGPGILYLLVLQAGLLFISRRRAWSAVATLTLVLAGLWGVVWAGLRFETDNRWWIHLYAMTTAAMSVGPALKIRNQMRMSSGKGNSRFFRGQGQAMVSLVIALLLESLAWWRGDFAGPECGMLLMVSAGLVLLGLLRPWFGLLVPVAAVWSGVLMTAWAAGLSTGGAQGAVGAAGAEGAGHLFAATCLGFAVIHACGGILGLLNVFDRKAGKLAAGDAQRWAWTACLPAFVYLVLMMLVDVPGWPYWLIGLAFAGAFFAVTVLVCRGRLTPKSGIAKCGLLNACGLGAIALTALAALDALWWIVPLLRLPVGKIELLALHPWLSLTWLALALVAMDQAIRLRQRVWAVGAGALAGAGLIPLAMPGLGGLAFGALPVFNLLTTTYGGAALLVAGLTARLLLAARFNQTESRVYQRWAIAWGLIALGLGWFAVVLQIWRGFHPDGDLDPITASEWMSYAVATVLIGGAVAWATWRRAAFAVWRDSGLSMWVVAAVFAGLGAGLIFNPGFGGTPVRGVVVFNSLWFLYGLPIGLCLGLRLVLRARATEASMLGVAQSWASKNVSDTRLPGALSVASLGLLITWLGLAVRHGFHGSASATADDFGISLTEWHTYALVFAGLGGVFAWRNASKQIDNVWRAFGYWAWLSAAAWSVLGLLVTRNPLWTDTQTPGWPIFNALWFFVGVPLFLCVSLLFVLTRWGADGSEAVTSLTKRWKKAERGLGITALVLLMAWVTLAVRQAFQGADLHVQHGMGSGEGYAYTMAWAAMGVGLLTAGIRTKSRTLRFASLAVMVAVTGKVFLIDMAALGDLWRVMSFLGLGLTLLGLGFVYQRWVFTKPQKPND